MAQDKFKLLVTKLSIWDALKTMATPWINLFELPNEVDFENKNCLGFVWSGKDNQSL